MTKQRSDLLQGTLDLLVLKTLAPAPLHGYGIAQRILITSREVLDVQQGSLYPALHRMEEGGWISAEWVSSDAGRRVRAYSLTRAGRKELEDAARRWSSVTSAVNRVLRMA